MRVFPSRRTTAIKLSNLSSGDSLITESREVPLSWIPRTSRGTTAKLRDDGEVAGRRRRGNALNLWQCHDVPLPLS